MKIFSIIIAILGFTAAIFNIYLLFSQDIKYQLNWRKRDIIEFIELLILKMPYIENCNCKFNVKRSKIKFLRIILKVNEKKEILEKLKNKNFYSINSFQSQLKFFIKGYVENYEVIIENI